MAQVWLSFDEIQQAFGCDAADARRRVNSPLTSSCGRLFDAVAAVAGVRQRVSYEAQAAIELEMAIGDSVTDAAYPLDILKGNDVALISTRPMFEALVADVLSNQPVSEISLRFHNGLVTTFVSLAETLRDRDSLNRVCLSGGTFNNLYLTMRLVRALTAAGFEVFTQNEVPAGDGGLSLGQAMVAACAKPENSTHGALRLASTPARTHSAVPRPKCRG